MKVHLIIKGIPLLYKALKKKNEIDFEFKGITLNDLVNNLGMKFGPAVKKALFDTKGEIDMEYRVVLNHTGYLSYGERMETTLNDGDTIHLMAVG